MSQEKTIKVSNGYLMLVLLIALIATILYGISQKSPSLIIPAALLFFIIMPGFFLVNPNTSKERKNNKK